MNRYIRSTVRYVAFVAILIAISRLLDIDSDGVIAFVALALAMPDPKTEAVVKAMEDELDKLNRKRMDR